MRTVSASLFVAAALLAAPAVADDSPPAPAQTVAALRASLRQVVEELTKSPSVVVAEIGGQTITRADVADQLRTMPPTDGSKTIDTVYHDAVFGLLSERALLIRAKQQGLDKDPAVVRRIASATNAILANEYLRRALETVVTDKMLHELYDREIAGNPGPDEVRGRIIVTHTREQALEVLGLLRNGEDFADVARHVSQDPTGPGGGDLGFIRQDAVAPEVGAVLFSLPPGQYCPYPIQAVSAWFVIKTEARRQLPTPAFDDVKLRLTQQLMRAFTVAAVKTAMTDLPQKDYGMTGKDAAVKK